MATKTGRIRYNLTERGRQHNGKDRRFDLRAMAALINGPKVQEKVKNRDLRGYYGHWIRQRFGMEPPESIVTPDGRVVNLEPALVTTYLWADQNGNVEHEAEFLDTEPGKAAQRVFLSKAGGFSSAVHAQPRGGMHVPEIFAGFDFVLEPNYNTNRGYNVFDSADSDLNPEMLLDCVAAEMQQTTAIMNALFDSVQRSAAADLELAAETIRRLQEENAELLSLASREHKGNIAVLDSVNTPGVRPLLIDTSATRRFAQAASAFNHADLPGFEPQADDKPARSDGLDAVHRHYGVQP